MRIRTYQDADASNLIDLTIAAFRPFHERSFPAMVSHDWELIAHQDGHWEQNYRDEIPTLHNPAEGRQVAVAESDDHEIVGYVAWKPDPHPDHCEIHILAVRESCRGAGIGSALMNYAMDSMRAEGVRFVGLGAGGDEFHVPARALYESLGFHPIPIVGYLRSL
jgi:ribosomal protein S18 acetylase RimI-like enzyme